MKLADFYARIAPFLLGEVDHKAAMSALWGRKPPMPDAARLRIYGRFCQNHRCETVDGVFENCRKLVQARHGEDQWLALTEDYFRAHPAHHFELTRNGEYFADFLKNRVAEQARGTTPLPPFLAELADLEWWEWQVMSALDDPADEHPETGPLRLGSTVEVRPYGWDLVSWLDDYADDQRPEQPAVESSVVLFWRDLKLSGRRELTSQLELMIIKAVVEAVPLSSELAGRLGVSPKQLRETAADLHDAGVLLGDPALLQAGARARGKSTRRAKK